MASITRASAEVDDTECADTPEEIAKLYEDLTNSAQLRQALGGYFYAFVPMFSLLVGYRLVFDRHNYLSKGFGYH